LRIKVKIKVNGSCHCGEIIFESIIDPMKVQICHCIDCQRLSGTAFRVTVMSEPDGVIFTKRKAKEYIKVAENGNRRAQGFFSIAVLIFMPLLKLNLIGYMA
jgi:hypothetical protein